MENKKLQFSVENISILEEDIDVSQFSLLAVDCFATGISAHATTLSEETLKKYSKTILQKPFVFAINKNFDDLGSHDKSEVPGGFIPHNSPITFRTLEDGRVMMSCEVLIWKRYCGKLLEYFARDGNKKSVSVEIEIIDSVEDQKSGLLEILDFSFNAITALGDFISPAIPNAQAVLQFSKEYEAAKNDYEFFSKYENIDFMIPQGIRDNVQKALDSYVKEEKTTSATNATLAIARYLAKNEKISPDKIKQMSKILNKKTLPSNMINLMGGDDGLDWALNLNKQLDLIDENSMSYFDELSDKNTDIIVDNYLGMEVLGMAKDKEGKEIEEPIDESKPKDEPKDKEKMSYGEFFSLEDMSVMFAEDDGDDEETKKKFSEAKEEFGMGVNPGTMFSAMFALIKKMQSKVDKFAEDSKIYMAENEELKKFKSEKDAEQKQFAIEKTIKELSERVRIPEEKRLEFIAEAEKYEFSNINQWQNYAKAEAFNFEAVGDKPKEEIIVYAFASANADQIASSDLWSDKIKESK